MKITEYQGFWVGRLEDVTLTEVEKQHLLKLGNEDTEEEILEMIEEAGKIADPKVLFAVSSIERAKDGVLVGGVSIDSPLVIAKLQDKNRCFPYIASCSSELDAFALAYKGDPLCEFWADAIKQEYLSKIMREYFTYIKKEYRIDKHFPALNPGSLADWPISGQKEQFEILGGRESVAAAIGVTYNESYLMYPNKSGSGIAFESEVLYENCQYCPLQDCPNRRAKRIE